MSIKLPPLNALKVFEVAARKLSFSQAAMELCVTQGAVSKQIKALEEHLQLPLFYRTPKGLELTAPGKLYLPTIMSALEQIHSSTVTLQQFSAEVQHLVLDISPSLSSLWMIPRLHLLDERFPSLRLSLISGDGAYQFNQSSADVAIRCLPLSLSHQNATLLTKEILLPVMHKDLLVNSPINEAKDLLKHSLIRPTTRPQLWNQCFNRFIGDDYGDNVPTSRHAFEHFFMSLEVVKQKQGIALIPEFLVENLLIDNQNEDEQIESLSNKELVNPLGLKYESGYGYYFLTPSFRHQDPMIKQLLEWFQVNLSDV
ncbi:LysR family transcriptional regulator [Marinomonas ushuaiensis DSM 15871]|uniref:LysR family transcriptional regulator n=1 Tax=Marinomonas ushuaiensis DSM 15871 TaxID=1122207 RepID=X7E3N6_9GAMM|nr:LysR family transcriptional regulator [Marinomonas ushuaiensis]ETX09781.1 LysR family transcriptional regulator [Marinomonas ushuaiensis DSM 15871]